MLATEKPPMTRTLRTLLLSAFALTVLAPTLVLAQSERSRVDTLYAFAKGGTLDLGLVSGNIIVTGWTRQEAKIYAFIEHGAFDVSLSGTQVSLQVRSRRGMTLFGSNDSRIEVMVPIGTRVNAHTVSGDIRIKATAGEVEARSVSGDVEVFDATERLVVHTVSGNAHLANAHGRIRFDATSGDLTLDDASGDISAKSVSGDVHLTNVRASQLRAETVSGNITYQGSAEGTGSFDLSSHSGDLRLEMPGNTAASLSLQTFSGDLSSQFPMTLQPGQNGRRNRKMEFTINGGGIRISAQTFSGNIHIERGANRASKEN